MIGTWRQTQARQTYLDKVDGILDGFPGEARVLDEVIEIATTVKITRDVINAYASANDGDEPDIADGLTAALKALGFKVVQ